MLVALFTVPFEDLCPLEQVVLFKDRYRLGTSGGRFWRVRGHEGTESRYNQGRVIHFRWVVKGPSKGTFTPLLATPVLVGITRGVICRNFCDKLQSLLTDLHHSDYNLSCVVSGLGCLAGQYSRCEQARSAAHRVQVAVKLFVYRGPCEQVRTHRKIGSTLWNQRCSSRRGC